VKSSESSDRAPEDVWLATARAAPVWGRVETLQHLAYPWRCLFLPALLLPLLAVPALARLPRAGLVAVIAAVLVLNLPHTEPRGYLTFDDEYYAPASIATRGLTTATREEYEPRWVGARPPFAEAPLVGLTAPVEVLRATASPTH
jgi:hypothetical protein